MAAQQKGLFELSPLQYRCEFTFPSAWGLFISLLVCKGFYNCQKIIFFIYFDKQTNKQASPAQMRKSNILP